MRKAATISGERWDPSVLNIFARPGFSSSAILRWRFENPQNYEPVSFRCIQDPETCTSANQPRCPSSLPWKNRFTGVFPANPFMRTPKREAIPKPYTTESQGDTNSEKLVGCLRHFHILFLRIERAFMLALLCHAP